MQRDRHLFSRGVDQVRVCGAGTAPRAGPSLRRTTVPTAYDRAGSPRRRCRCPARVPRRGRSGPAPGPARPGRTGENTTGRPSWGTDAAVPFSSAPMEAWMKSRPPVCSCARCGEVLLAAHVVGVVDDIVGAEDRGHGQVPQRDVQYDGARRAGVEAGVRGGGGGREGHQVVCGQGLVEAAAVPYPGAGQQPGVVGGEAGGALRVRVVHGERVEVRVDDREEAQHLAVDDAGTDEGDAGGPAPVEQEPGGERGGRGGAPGGDEGNPRPGPRGARSPGSSAGSRRWRARGRPRRCPGRTRSTSCRRPHRPVPRRRPPCRGSRGGR